MGKTLNTAGTRPPVFGHAGPRADPAELPACTNLRDCYDLAHGPATTGVRRFCRRRPSDAAAETSILDMMDAATMEHAPRAAKAP
jgi:hypothetical protein